MAAEFAAGDELLHAQGILVVYYLIFRSAVIYGEEAKITRRSLLDFRQKLAENREAAIKIMRGPHSICLSLIALISRGPMMLLV